MTYRLEFLPSAQKEWDKLGAPIKSQFKKKLQERLETPCVPSAALHGIPDCYKIKLRQSGYRLVYRVEDQRVTVVVIAVGKRDRSKMYESAKRRNPHSPIANKLAFPADTWTVSWNSVSVAV